MLKHNQKLKRRAKDALVSAALAKATAAGAEGGKKKDKSPSAPPPVDMGRNPAFGGM